MCREKSSKRTSFVGDFMPISCRGSQPRILFSCCRGEVCLRNRLRYGAGFLGRFNGFMG